MSIINQLSAPLDMNDIDWRVQSCNQKGAVLLAYKDARVDMNRLDQVCGELWQSKYDRDSKGVLQCGIGIYIRELEEWVWRWSNGTESKSDSIKGEYSDALKRAGFMWGIGRELYDVPFTWCAFKQDEFESYNGKIRTTFKFTPNEWTWNIDFNNQTVTAKDKNGNIRVGRQPQNTTPQQGTTTQSKTTEKPQKKMSLDEVKADLVSKLKGGFIQEKEDFASLLIKIGKDSARAWFKNYNSLEQPDKTEIANKLSFLVENYATPEELRIGLQEVTTDLLPF